MSILAARQRSSAPPTDQLVTPRELYQNPQWGRCELIDGKVIPMSPAGHTHGKIAARLLLLIGNFVEARKLGTIYGAETGFVFPDGQTVRAPDVMFLSAPRTPADLSEDGFLPVVPDFAVEVASPTDSFQDVTGKADSYVRAGVRLVWVVDCNARRVFVFRTGQPVCGFDVGMQLDGGDVIPSLEIPVAAIFK